MSRRPPQSSGRLVGIGGAALLALASLSPLLGVEIPRLAAALAACVGYAAIAAAFYGTRARSAPTATPALTPAVEAAPRPPRADFDTGPASVGMARRLHDWLVTRDPAEQPGRAFDQFARELLGASAGAAGVRCFWVDAEQDALRPFSGNAREPRVSAQEGILGHVAATGRPFWVNGPTAGPLLRRLASDAQREWAWAWPVRRDGATLAVVAATQIERGSEALLDELGALLEIGFRCTFAEDALHQARRTDPATGVLTRSDFFARAEALVDEANQANEPVALVALGVEGLRGLDDGGHWSDRDALVAEIGALVRRCVRADDLIGRFTDDRFVVLLRRVDGGLARLISEKLEAGAREFFAAHDGGAAAQVRLGVAAAGLRKRPMRELLSAALGACDAARRQGKAILAESAATDAGGRAS